MFDFLRNLTKSAEEKRQERLNVYLDGELSPREQAQFEAELAHDPALRTELESLRELKLNMQQLPRMRAPRNYTLDPAVYGKPASGSTWQLYPALRVATALTAFFFVIAVVMDMLTPAAGAIDEPIARLVAPAEAPASEAMSEDAVQDMAPSETSAETSGEAEQEAMTVEEATEAETATEGAGGEAGAAEAVAPREAADEGYELENVAPTPTTEPAGTVEVTRTVAEPAGTPAVTRVVTETEQAEETAEDTEAANAAETMAAAAETSAPEALAPRPTEAIAEEGVRAVEVTRVVETTPEETIAKESDPSPTPFPWLLVAEIAFGVILIALVVTTAVVRRKLTP